MENKETVQAYERALGEAFKDEAHVSVEAAHNGIVITAMKMSPPAQRLVIPDSVLKASTSNRGALYEHMRGAVRAMLDGKPYEPHRFIGLASDAGGKL